MQYLFVPPSRLSTTSIVAAPAGTANGSPLATTLSRPDLTLAIFTADGPPGAAAFLYLKRVVEPFVLQQVFGRLNVTGPLPSSKLIEESAPPTGSEPAMLMLGSFESRTILPALEEQLLSRDALVGGVRVASGQHNGDEDGFLRRDRERGTP